MCVRILRIYDKSLECFQFDALSFLYKQIFINANGFLHFEHQDSHNCNVSVSFLSHTSPSAAHQHLQHTQPIVLVHGQTPFLKI